MAEGDSADFEVKDEELVDFEGSDYGFGSDEELEIEETSKQCAESRLPTPAANSDTPGQDLVATGDFPMATQASSDAGRGPHISAKEGAESGEIQEEKEDKEDGVVMQPAKAIIASGGGASNVGKRVAESRHKKHRKADLEDGELDDAAMHEGSDREAEGNVDEDDEDSISRQERKRRKDRFAPERQVSEVEKKDRREADQGAVSNAKQNRSHASDRHLDRSRSLSKSSAGPRGSNHETTSYAQAGIMGPGRLLVPADLASQMQLRQLGRGFIGPVGGLYTPANARPNLHLQEALAQEQRFRSQRIMQLAQANANGPGRPLLRAHLGVPPMHHALPTLGVQQGLLHWPAQGQELMQQFNLMAPMDSYGRNPRPYITGRGIGPVGGMYGIVAGSPGTRQMSWSAVPMPNAVQGIGRGRTHGRGQVLTQVWGDPRPAGVVGQAVVGVVNVGQGMGQGLVAVGLGSGGQQVAPGLGQGLGQASSQGLIQSIGQGMVHPPERAAKQGYSQAGGQGGAGIPVGSRAAQPIQVPGAGVNCRGVRASSHGSGCGATSREANLDARRGDSSRTTSDHRSGEALSSRKGQNPKSDRRPGSAGRSHLRQERENGRDKHRSANSSSSGHTGPLANGGLSTLASNLIQLGGPVHKSRVLTVSGLPDGTSMTAIVEAFEKQGKITDFKKEDKGDTFTITFASVSEAISAKRHLHRSVMGGRQITVEYAVLRV